MDQEQVFDNLHWLDVIPPVAPESHVIVYVLLLTQFSICFQTYQITYSNHIQNPPPFQEQIF